MAATSGVRERQLAWFVFVILAAANYGNYYVYDSIGPLADLLQRQPEGPWNTGFELATGARHGR